MSFDAFGQKKEITILKDWLQFTNEIVVEIPKNHIATFLTPDNSASKLYDLEKEKEDLDPTENKIVFSPDDKITDDETTKNEEPIDDYIPNLMNYLKHILLTNIQLPPFVLDEIMNGLLYGDGENISDIYTGDEQDREDFGNKWTDWEIDPEEYLK